MTARCKCGKMWVVSIYTNLSPYVCPHCAKRRRADAIASIRKPGKEAPHATIQT